MLFIYLDAFECYGNNNNNNNNNNNHINLGVCKKPTDPSNPTQPNPTRRVESVFKAWWVGLGWVTNFFFIAGRVGFGL